MKENPECPNCDKRCGWCGTPLGHLELGQCCARAKVWLMLPMRAKTSPDPEPCHEWEHGIGLDGYGKVRIGNRTLRAHRIVYEFFIGPIEPGQVILHSCDNKKCVNIAHLAAGTNKQNAADAFERGLRKRGSAAYQAKLSEQSVRDARRRNRAGETLKSLAAEYGVNHGTLWQAVTGRTWKHVK